MRGKVLGGYRLLTEVGSGGMGTVWLAEPADAEGSGRVALKVLHPHLLKSPGFFKRFLREAEAGMGIRHPNVVRTLDADAVQEDGQVYHYLVMEYVEGQTLRSLLGELGWFPEDLVRHVAREIARSLVAIHGAGLIHRDLKPENVLITADERVKVMDLGVARVRDEALRLSREGQFVGSLQYASPEQFREGGETLDGRADLYSLGLLLCELATGRHPFESSELTLLVRQHLEVDPEPPSRLNPRISPFLEELILTLARKRPADRFPSAPALLEALEGGEESTWWTARSGDIVRRTRRPLRRVRIPRETALHGRERELAHLGGLWERARGGAGQVVLITGEAGIGKSRLVDEFAGGLEARGEDLAFLFGAWPPGGAATPAGALAAACREHLGEEGLEARLEALLPDLPGLTPTFAALLRGRPAPRGSAALDRDARQTLFVRLVHALSADRPALLLVDDLHFAPEEGLELFAALAMAVAGRPVLLAGTARPGLPEDWMAGLVRLPHVSRLPVPRLGPGEVRRLLAEDLRSERLAEDLYVEVTRKTDGNPFFVFEILRDLRDERRIVPRESGRWSRVGDLGELRIPASVRDLVAARIARLDEADRDLLDVAACAGFEFDPILVAEAAGTGPIPTLKRLSRLEREHRLVHSSGRRFVFDHHQVQEALYAALPELLREEYHGALAVAIERAAGASERDVGELPGELVVELAGHHLRAGRVAASDRYLLPALDHLEDCHLHAPAADLAARALALPGLLEGAGRVRVLLRRARRLELLSRPAEEKRTLDEALDLAGRCGAPRALGAEVRLAVASNLRQAGRAEDALALTLEAEALAAKDGDRQGVASAVGLRGTLLADLGRYDEAREAYERHLAAAREAGDRVGEGKATGNLALHAWELGESETALRLYEECLAIFRETGSRRGECAATGNRGLVLMNLGRYEEAREHFERHREISREIGYRRGEAMALGNLGQIFQTLGHLAEALRHYEDDLEIAVQLGNPVHEGISHMNRGHLLLHLGDREGAVADLRTAERFFAEAGYRWGIAYTRCYRGLSAELAGEPREALRLYEETRVLGRELGLKADPGQAAAGLARALLSLGEREAAEAAAREALAAAEGEDSAAGCALALSLLARLGSEAPGAVRERVAGLDPRLTVTERLRVHYDLHLADGGAADLEEAVRLFDHLWRHAPGERRGAMVRGVGVFREVLAAGDRMDGDEERGHA